MTDQNKTYLCIIADRSGSMQALAGDMNGAITALLEEQGKQPGELHVDVVRFDTDVETLYEDVRADDVKNAIIEPRGSTALNDALGITIVRLGEKFEAMSEDERPGHVLVVVVTDGYENASHEYTTSQVKALIEKQTNQFGWEFLYLATNVDAFETGDQYGFGRGQTIAFAASPDGAHSVVASASAYATRSRLSDDVTEFTDAERASAAGE